MLKRIVETVGDYNSPFPTQDLAIVLYPGPSLAHSFCRCQHLGSGVYALTSQMNAFSSALRVHAVIYSLDEKRPVGVTNMADKIVNNFHGQNPFQFHGQN